MGGIRVNAAVMTHPRRWDAAQRLARNAGSACEVVVDPWPAGPPTGLRTAILAWDSVADDATHRLVLEDDARLAPGFIAHARLAAESAPHAAIVFHANWCSRSGAAVRLAALAGARWARMAAEYTPNVALMLPREVGRGFAEFARSSTHTLPDDLLMARYLRKAGVPTYLCVPNLVEHRELPSLNDNDSHGVRLSACFRALPVDAVWEQARPLQPSVVPLFKNGMALCVFAEPNGRWRTLGAGRAIQRLGLDSADCDERLARVAKRHPGATESVRGQVGESSLYACLLSAYLTGYLGYGLAGHGDAVQTVRAWAADPLVEQALATIGAGGLCYRLTASELARLGPPVGELVNDAVAEGAYAADASRTKSASAYRHSANPVVLVSRDDALVRCLAADLADRGHPVSVISPEEWEAAATPGAVLVYCGADGEQISARAVAVGYRYVVNVVTHRKARGYRRGARPAVTRDPSQPVAVLRIGLHYGPGIPGTVADMVNASLERQPISFALRAAQPLQMIHVWDLGAALHKVLAKRPNGVEYEVCHERVVTPRDLATAVTKSVAEVPIVIDGDEMAALALFDVPLSGQQLEDDMGWRPIYDLDEGVRTVAQWLAYEAE